jgi:hypothetical protein
MCYNWGGLRITVCFNILPQAQQGRNHIELGTKELKPTRYDWFSKDIRKLVLAWNKTYIKLFGRNSIKNKVEVYFHMFMYFIIWGRNISREGRRHRGIRSKNNCCGTTSSECKKDKRQWYSRLFLRWIGWKGKRDTLKTTSREKRK